MTDSLKVRGRANSPTELRDKIEEAALVCQHIGDTLSFLSRQEDLPPDFAAALSVLERLSHRTADDIDDMILHLPGD